MKYLIETLKTVSDPRQHAKITYPLFEILALCIIAVMCGAESTSQIHDFGKVQLELLREYMPLTHGIAHRLTIERVLNILSVKQFESVFNLIMKRAAQVSKGTIVSLDGKSFHTERDESGKAHPLYIVSAWLNHNSITLGQVKTEEKKNEISTIPALLKLLDIKGSVVTIDAIGCQYEIVNQIVTKNKADYCIALKDNQPTMHAEFASYAEDCMNDPLLKDQYEVHETSEKDHGRIEVRRYTLFRDLTWFADIKKWKNLRSLVRVDSTRTVGKRPPTHETRYYITSLVCVYDAANAIRSHWGIENRLHWMLDVVFREDHWATRRTNEAANLAVIRKYSLHFLRNTPFPGGQDISAPRKMFMLSLDRSFLRSLLDSVILPS